MSLTPDQDKVADGIKDLLQGQLSLGLGSLPLVSACKRGGVGRDSVAAGLSRYMANGGEEAMATLGMFITSMGAGKLGEVLHRHCPEEFAKDVEAEVRE